jgi:ribonuclease-3
MPVSDRGSREPVPADDQGDAARLALPALVQRLGHGFIDPALLTTALTHRSAAQEGGRPSYERLEFLGDAVLGMLAAEWLYGRVGADEGELS